MKVGFALLHVAPVDDPEFSPVEYGEISVSCLHGDSCGDRNIRGVQVFVGDIPVEGVCEERGNVFILFGNGNGVDRVRAAIHFRSVFHLYLPGEYVLVLQGKSFEEIAEEEKKNWESMTLEEHMQVYESQGIARKEAMKLVAKDRGISKRDVYQALLS